VTEASREVREVLLPSRPVVTQSITAEKVHTAEDPAEKVHTAEDPAEKVHMAEDRRLLEAEEDWRLDEAFAEAVLGHRERRKLRHGCTNARSGCRVLPPPRR